MKIAIFTEVYLPYINGVVTHIKTLKEGLEARGHQVLIVAANSAKKKSAISNSRDNGEILYSPGVRLKSLYNYDIAAPLSRSRMKIIKAWNPDIIHVHNEFGIGMSGALLARVLKVPLVYTLHTNYDDYMCYVGGKRIAGMVKPFSHGYARALANIADVVIGPSEKVSAYFKKCKVKKEVVIVPNAMEINLFDRANVDADKIRAIRDGLDFAPTDFVLGFCGRLGSEKNIDTLLKFISKTIRPDDGVKFMIIGGGPLAEELPLLAHKLALSNIVKFAGRIEHPDVPPYFAACDAYITASLSEIHSISTLEAQAMGLPVVQIREKIDIGQVVDGENGYFFGNAQEMRDKIILLKSLPKIRYEELRQNVRQSIMHLSPSALAERVETIYEGAIGNYKRSGSMRVKIKVMFKKDKK